MQRAFVAARGETVYVWPIRLGLPERDCEELMETYPETDVQPAENGNGHPFIIGLICGAAVGALAGLLLAPKPGAELRSDMTDSARRLRRKAGEMYDGASQAVNDVATRSRRAFEAGRDALQSARPSGAKTSSVDAPVA